MVIHMPLMMRKVGILLVVRTRRCLGDNACVATSYSLVFMDVQMPVMDGFEATRATKASCLTHSPKIVFCTAHAVEDYRDMAFSVGGDGFVPKPFDLTKIGDCLKDQIGYTFCRS